MNSIEALAFGCHLVLKLGYYSKGLEERTDVVIPECKRVLMRISMQEMQQGGGGGEGEGLKPIQSNTNTNKDRLNYGRPLLVHRMWSFFSSPSSPPPSQHTLLTLTH